MEYPELAELIDVLDFRGFFVIYCNFSSTRNKTLCWGQGGLIHRKGWKKKRNINFKKCQNCIIKYFKVKKFEVRTLNTTSFPSGGTLMLLVAYKQINCLCFNFPFAYGFYLFVCTFSLRYTTLNYVAETKVGEYTSSYQIQYALSIGEMNPWKDRRPNKHANYAKSKKAKFCWLVCQWTLVILSLAR